jgi:TrmH family RNA methyltransferase
VPFESVGAKNPLIAQTRRLVRRRSERATQHRFVIEGATLLQVALDAEASVELVLRDGAAPLDDTTMALAERAARAGARLVELPTGIMARVTDTVTPQPLAAVVATPPADLTEALAEAVGRESPVLVLAEVSDPGNAGTLLRSAEAAGCAAVVFSGGVDPFGPKTVRASAGAVFLVPVISEPALAVALAALGDAGMRRVGLAAHDGAPLDQTDLTGPVAFVLGSESHGLPDGLDRVLDQLVTIPLTGRTESLNVAMAGTLAVFEAARQRRSAG